MADAVDIDQRSSEFAVRIVKLSRTLDKSAGAPRTLANRLLKAGTSIGANVEEGQAAQSKADFISKFSIAQKEARETRYWLRLLVATGIVTKPRLSPLLDEADQIARILSSIVATAKQRRKSK